MKAMNMNCENIRNQMIDYIDGKLNAEEQALFEAGLAECPECVQELEELQQLFASFKEEPQEQPSAALRMNFETVLAEEKAAQETKVIPLQPKTNWKVYLRAAASVVIVASAFFIGRMSLNNSEKNLQTAEILEKITSESASMRIAALNLSEEVVVEDSKIIQALIDRLLYDEKPSVRLAAVEALTKFSSLDKVKNALIKSLETDSDPAVQIELIQVLVKIQEKRALPPMKNLLKQEQVPEYVKKEIEFNIPSLV